MRARVVVYLPPPGPPPPPTPTSQALEHRRGTSVGFDGVFTAHLFMLLLPLLQAAWACMFACVPACVYAAIGVRVLPDRDNDFDPAAKLTPAPGWVSAVCACLHVGPEVHFN